MEKGPQINRNVKPVHIKPNLWVSMVHMLINEKKLTVLYQVTLSKKTLSNHLKGKTYDIPYTCMLSYFQSSMRAKTLPRDKIRIMRPLPIQF